MKATCQEKDGVCTQCGLAIQPSWRRTCGAAKHLLPTTVITTSPGLGDAVESALKSFGITPEKWIQFKKEHGFEPTCNCGDRKEWLNHLGRAFGEAAKEGIWSALWPKEKLMRLLPKKQPPG